MSQVPSPAPSQSPANNPSQTSPPAAPQAQSTGNATPAPAGPPPKEEPKGTPPPSNIYNAAVGKAKKYVRVFADIFISESIIERFQDSLPKLPNLDLDLADFGCQGALAALNFASDLLEQAMSIPQRVCELAKSIVDDMIDFGTAQAEKVLDAITSTMEEFEEKAEQIISETIQEIEEALSGIDFGIDLGFGGASLGDLGPGLLRMKRALQSLLDCPFLSDLPIAKQAGAVLDLLDAVGVEEILSTLPSKPGEEGDEGGQGGGEEEKTFGQKIAESIGGAISSAIKGLMETLKATMQAQINALRNIPLAVIGQMQKMLDNLVERIGLAEIAGVVNDLASCVASLCAAQGESTSIENAKPPQSVSQILGKANAVFYPEGAPEGVGKIQAVVVNPVGALQEHALAFAGKISPFKTANPKK